MNDFGNVSAFSMHHACKKLKKSDSLQLQAKVGKNRKTRRKIKIKELKQDERLSSTSCVEVGNGAVSTEDTDTENCLDMQQMEVKTNSFEEGKEKFQWILHPLNLETFMSESWEKKPEWIRAKKDFTKLFSVSKMDEILHKNQLFYGKNVDVTFYSNDSEQKEVHNVPGRARAFSIWDSYVNKCSIRLLNPQTYVPAIHTLNSSLQEYFGCFVGTNSYLTPASSQGFAPHFDDIEAFILQVEGKKRWKVYEPRNNMEKLPRYSSRDFNRRELGKPMMDIILEAGDVLYLPRGYIHEAMSLESHHSLHVTLSVYQRNAWIDLVEKILPNALKEACKHDEAFRRGLPLNYLKACGFARKPNLSQNRRDMKKTLKSLIHSLSKYVDLDAGVDGMGESFIHDALPPAVTEAEASVSIFKYKRLYKNGSLTKDAEFNLEKDAQVALLRDHVCRLCKKFVVDEEFGNHLEFHLYYSIDNSLEYHERDSQFLVLSENLAGMMQFVIQRYPEFVPLSDLPNFNFEDDECFAFIRDLWEVGVLKLK